MNKTLLALLAVCGLLVGVLAGYGLFHQDNTLGATISNNTALNQARLFTGLNSLATDVAAVRPISASFVGTLVNATTQTIGPFAVSGVFNPTSTTSTAITVAGAKFGDFAFCSYSGAPSATIQWTGSAQSGTVLCTSARIDSGTGPSPVGTGTITAVDLQGSTFSSVLITATST